MSLDRCPSCFQKSVIPNDLMRSLVIGHSPTLLYFSWVRNLLASPLSWKLTLVCNLKTWQGDTWLVEILVKLARGRRWECCCKFLVLWDTSQWIHHPQNCKNIPRNSDLPDWKYLTDQIFMPQGSKLPWIYA